MKTSKYIVSIIAFTLTNFMYFVWQPYSKGIIIFPIADNSVSTIISNILYFVVYSLIVVLTFNYSLCGEKEKRISKKGMVFTSLGFIGMRLVLDGIKGLVYLYFADYIYVVNDICSAIFFAVSFLFIIKFNKLQPYKENKGMLSILFFVLAVVTLLVFIIFNIFDVIDKNHMGLKYYTNSDIFLSKMRYSNFISEIKSMLAETIFQVIFFGACYLYFINPSVKEEAQYNKSRTVSKTIVRIMLIVFGCFALSTLKAGFLTEGTIGNVYTTGAITNHIAPNKLDVNYKTLRISRRRQGNKQEEVFNKSTVEFMFNSSILHSETVANISGVEVPRELIAVTQYEVDGIEFHVDANDLIAIRNDNNYFRFYKLKELKNQEYNEKLVACCEYMITGGTFSFFEYGYEYLLKHDPEFIKPFISYYSEGDFSEVELGNPYNVGINPIYMKKLAQSVNID